MHVFSFVLLHRFQKPSESASGLESLFAWWLETISILPVQLPLNVAFCILEMISCVWRAKSSTDAFTMKWERSDKHRERGFDWSADDCENKKSDTIKTQTLECCVRCAVMHLLTIMAWLTVITNVIKTSLLICSSFLCFISQPMPPTLGGGHSVFFESHCFTDKSAYILYSSRSTHIFSEWT